MNRIDFAVTHWASTVWLYPHFFLLPHTGLCGKEKVMLRYKSHTFISGSSIEGDNDAAPGLSWSLRSADNWRHRLSVIRADSSRSLTLGLTFGVLESLSQLL